MRTPLKEGGLVLYVRRTLQRNDVMANPLQFAQQVRAEMAKVTWPGRREVMLTTAMVLMMAALAAMFFLAVDLVIREVLILIVGAI
jgi:preprotein translocase subunit SecE